MQTMEQGAQIIVCHWLKARREERIAILSDPSSRAQAEALLDAAQRAGAEVTLRLIEQGEEQPGAVLQAPALQRAIAAAETIVGATCTSLLTTRAIAEAVGAGKRYLSLPLAAGQLPMLSYPFLCMPPETAARMAKPLLETYRDCRGIRVTTPAGTDLTLSVEGRKALAFTGDFSYSRCDSACFEVTIPPVETSAEGVLVVDGSLGYLGAPGKPLRIRFHRGRIAEIEAGEDGERLRTYLAAFRDEGMQVAGEFGIGLNTLARCTGACYIEDESAFGTFHVGMGRNLTFGGIHDAAGHFDLVGLDPTIYFDGKHITLPYVRGARTEDNHEDSVYRF